MDDISAALSQPHHSWIHAVRVTEARLFAFRCVAFEVGKRASLFNSSAVSCFNSSKASAALESHDQVAEDARHTHVMAMRLLSGLLKEPPGRRAPGSSDGSPLSSASVVRETCRILGSLAGWMRKVSGSGPSVATRVSDSDDGVADTGLLLSGALEYLVAALAVPEALYHAAQSLRLLCHQCAGVISGNSTLLETILREWGQLVGVNAAFISLVQESLSEYVSVARTLVHSRLVCWVHWL